MAVLARLEGVTHYYGKVRALNDITIDITEGKWALIGPNGAGKTTLIKILLGIIKPTRGYAEILGENSLKVGRKILQHVGYVPEIEALPQEWPAIDFIAHLGRFSGMPKHEAFRRANEVLNYLGMSEMRLRKIGSLSQGNKQKVKIAAALIHDPDFLIFDEPTANLDPESREGILSVIKELGEEGKSLILSTHIMKDVETVCDRAIFLFAGEVRNVTSIAKTKEKISKISIKTSKPVELSNELKRRGFMVTASGPYLIVEASNNNIINEILDAAVTVKADIRKMGRALLGVEEYFLTLVSKR